MTAKLKLSAPKLPTLPQASGQRAHDATKETLETMRGTRGNILDRAIFVRDLTDLGILDLAGGKVGVGGAITNPTAPGISNETPGGDTSTPPLLFNIVATAGFSHILLTWNDPHFGPLAYYEVWRKTVTTMFDVADTNNIPPAQLFITADELEELEYYANISEQTAEVVIMQNALFALQDATAAYNASSEATLIDLRTARIGLSAARANDNAGAIRVGTSLAPLFSDPVDKGTTYIYWVRAVSKSGALGPFNAEGVVATTQPDIGMIMRQLTDELYKTQIADFIFNGINVDDFDAVFGDGASVGMTLVQQQGWISELQAGWGVRVSQTANGQTYISGFGLNQEINENGGFSTFLVAANRFAVIDPADQTAVAPFIIDAGKTYINAAMIKKASIMELIAGSVVADFVRVGAGLISPHMTSGTINIGTYTQTDPDDPTSWVYDPSTGRQGNFSVDAAGNMFATYALLKGIIVTDTSNRIVLDTINNTYQTALVSKDNPINASNIGTFISKLAVNSLHIQGNAITVPAAATWAGSLSLTSAWLWLISYGMPFYVAPAGDAAVDDSITVAVFWAAECSAENTNAQLRSFRIRKYWGGGNEVIYQSFSGSRNVDQFSSGVVMTTINAGAQYRFYLEATGSGVAYQSSLFAIAVRR